MTLRIMLRVMPFHLRYSQPIVEMADFWPLNLRWALKQIWKPWIYQRWVSGFVQIVSTHFIYFGQWIRNVNTMGTREGQMTGITREKQKYVVSFFIHPFRGKMLIRQMILTLCVYVHSYIFFFRYTCCKLTVLV